jgi:pimeloyl-ACP methyl ester carboxylesterase
MLVVNDTHLYYEEAGVGPAVVLIHGFTLDTHMWDDQFLPLALIDTILGGHAWSAAGSARDALVWQEAARGGIPAAKASWLAHPIFAPALRQPAVGSRLRQIIADYTGWHFVNANPEQSLTPPAAQRLHELRLPVLAMVGEHDLPDFVQIAALIGREAPQARTVVAPGVGHMANMESPALVTQALRDFLQAVAPGAK